MASIKVTMNADMFGWVAATLMLATFGCREARCMRPLAVGTNLAFIGYGLAAGLPPVLSLHLLLLPINLWRWWECLRRGPAPHPSI
jgi:CRP/FNR family transcriptional regulator, cyclic AMP receptor protein